MKRTMRVFLFTGLVLLAVFPAFAASPYTNNATLAVQWLSQHQNVDGSWGITADVQLPCTVEAVLALYALNQQDAAYYQGITWLENHAAPNVDYAARRIIALVPHGDYLNTDFATIQSAQMHIAQVPTGDNGWGLTAGYQGTPIDSAMALLASSAMNVTTNVQPALNYLKGAQLTGADTGWPVAQEATGDPLTTALVIQSLIGYKTLDSTLSTTYIPKGLSSLSTNVGTSSPVYLQALAALTYLQDDSSNSKSQAATLLTNLASASVQASDGSWSEDPYATAIAARAMAAAMGTNVPKLSTVVEVPDENLRAAINYALGRNAMDAITYGDMLNLTSLNAAGMGISNIEGLEYATNLAYVNLDNNNISSSQLDKTTGVLSGISGLVYGSQNELISGNPGTPPPVDPPEPPGEGVPVPAMSLPAFLFTALLLIATIAFMRRNKRSASGEAPGQRKPRSWWIHFCVLLGFMISFLSTQGALAADPGAASRQPLDPGTLQKIQAAGQAVLAAKRSWPTDPDMAALKKTVEDLRAAIMSFQSSVLAPVKISPSGASAPFVQSASPANPQGESNVRAALDAMRKQRTAVQQGMPQGASEERMALRQGAAAKVQALEAEVEEALASPLDEKAAKLAQLRERLANRPTVSGPRPDVNRTPTISTITRHVGQQ